MTDLKQMLEKRAGRADEAGSEHLRQRVVMSLATQKGGELFPQSRRRYSGPLVGLATAVVIVIGLGAATLFPRSASVSPGVDPSPPTLAPPSSITDSTTAMSEQPSTTVPATDPVNDGSVETSFAFDGQLYWQLVPADETGLTDYSWWVALEGTGDSFVALAQRDPGFGETNRKFALYSADGVTWTETYGFLDAGALSALAAGDAGVVAGGSTLIGSQDCECDAAVWYSPDGLAWDRIPHDEEVFGGVARGAAAIAEASSEPVDWLVGGSCGTWAVTQSLPEGEQVINDIAFGPAGFVAVGSERYNTLRPGAQLSDCSPGERQDDAAVWISPDGLEWSRVVHDEETFGGSGAQVMTSVVAGDAGYWAYGTSSQRATFWFSTDGANWTRDRAGRLPLQLVAGEAGLLAANRYGDGAELWTSTDGKDWSKVPIPPFMVAGLEPFSGPGLQLATVGDQYILATSEPDPASDAAVPTVWLSPDGETWNRVDDSIGVFPRWSTMEYASMYFHIASDGTRVVIIMTPGESIRGPSEIGPTVWLGTPSKVDLR